MQIVFKCHIIRNRASPFFNRSKTSRGNVDGITCLFLCAKDLCKWLEAEEQRSQRLSTVWTRPKTVESDLIKINTNCQCFLALLIKLRGTQSQCVMHPASIREIDNKCGITLGKSRPTLCLSNFSQKIASRNCFKEVVFNLFLKMAPVQLSVPTAEMCTFVS